MTKKLFIKLGLVFSFFVFISAFSSVEINTVVGQECENTPATNEAIVNSLYDKIKGNKNLAPQISHINITSTNRAIKIQGYVDSKSDYDKVLEYALEVECALKVNINGFNDEKPADGSNLLPGPGGCEPGTKQCGDLCIPDNDVCNVGGGKF